MIFETEVIASYNPHLQSRKIQIALKAPWDAEVELADKDDLWTNADERPCFFSLFKSQKEQPTSLKCTDCIANQRECLKQQIQA